MKRKLKISHKVSFIIQLPNQFTFTGVSGKEVKATLKEIKSLSGKIKFQVFSCKPFAVDIELIPDEKIKRRFRSHNIWDLFPYYLLVFSQNFIVKGPPSRHSGPDFAKLSLKEINSRYKEISAEVFAEEVRYFLFLTQLAKPGHIWARDGRLYYDRKFYREIGGVFHDIDSVIKITKKMKWPKIYNLKILDVWNWVDSFPCGREKFGYSPVGRVLAAFSHIFDLKPSSSKTAIDLFWCLVGLEALYTKGEGITHQLIEKTQILLGRQRDFLKHIKEMYNYRSRFVHGQIPFPGLFYSYDAKKYIKESSKMVEVAEAILLASLQELIKRGWHKLDFKYVLESQNSENSPKS